MSSEARARDPVALDGLPTAPTEGDSTTAGRYQIVRTIADGGMGTVHLAVRKEGAFRRMYAVKRLRDVYADDPDAVSMFLDEARLAGLVRHPNVVSVIDVGEDDRGAYLVMDFIEGFPCSVLLTDCKERGVLPPVQICVRIIREVALGLHAAHELVGTSGEPLHLVHRDVSPQNILLGFDGVARLTDFGIAKAFGRTTKTTTGLLKGKAGYMSPEQLRFENPDRRSDLFSLGVCLYELLSGDRLYREEDVQTAARRILNEPPPDIDDVRDDVPASLVELLFELLAKDPSHRPHLAREVARRLEDVLTELVPTEGAFELADYLEAHYGPHRRRLLEDIERLWAEVDESERSGAPLELVPSRITSPPDAAGRSGVHRPRRRRRLGFLAAMLAAFVIATVVGIVLGLSLNEPSPPTPMAAPAEETGTSPTDPAEFPSAEPLELDPIELEVAPAAPEAPAEETASELVPDPEAGPGSSDEAARARARRRRRAARMRADMLWDW